jgi:UDP-glucose 4-epimerase
MKILITGGAGFIGSHLVDSYLKEDHDVYVIDNFSTGSAHNIAHNRSNTYFHFYEDTIFNEDLMLELIGTCDLVIHMAAAVGVKYVLEHPLTSIKTNIHGTDIVLELCDKFRKKVLIASTSEVYGKHTHAPLVETDDIVYGSSTTWRWSYAASKLVDEFHAIAYHRAHKLPVVIVRFFNTVGPRQSKEYGMVIPRFIDQAHHHQNITVFGDGKQTRTFTYVADVVEAVKKLVTVKDAEGQVVNIGGAEEVSINELAQRITQKMGSQSILEHIPYEKAYNKNFEDMMRRVPSTVKLTSLIGFAPTTSLDAILDHTIADYQAQLKKAS